VFCPGSGSSGTFLVQAGSFTVLFRVGQVLPYFRYVRYSTVKFKVSQLRYWFRWDLNFYSFKYVMNCPGLGR
jgi:hypothetical protein